VFDVYQMKNIYFSLTPLGKTTTLKQDCVNFVAT